MTRDGRYTSLRPIACQSGGHSNEGRAVGSPGGVASAPCKRRSFPNGIARRLEYADLCGRTPAHAHARSGEPAKISGYLGKSEKFDEAIADSSVAYADQTERDHEVLMKGVCAVNLEVLIEL